MSGLRLWIGGAAVLTLNLALVMALYAAQTGDGGSDGALAEIANPPASLQSMKMAEASAC